MTMVFDQYYLGITALVTVVYQAAFFCVAAGLKIDKVTDFAGTTNFIVLALLTAILKGEWSARQTIVTVLVVVWGLRLASFLLLRILSWGEDRRFDGTRDNLLHLAGFWAIQAVWVWVTCLSVIFLNSSSHNPSLGAADVIGWVIWAIGLVLEATADQQKLNYKKSDVSRGHWCDVGVWRWSRHPNYAGEMLVWWGIFIASSPSYSGVEWAAIISPLFITSLLLFLSGMPILEASAEKKYGSRADYRDYKRRTSPVIPFPPSLYANLPQVVKMLLFLELPLYSSPQPSTEEPLQQ